jgi:ribosomal protein S12
METATDKLIQAIEKLRAKRRMSDKEFSTKVLGISPAYLCLLKAGKRPLRPNLAVLFMQKLPELTPEVTAFILSQGNDHEAIQITDELGTWLERRRGGK